MPGAGAGDALGAMGPAAPSRLSCRTLVAVLTLIAAAWWGALAWSGLAVRGAAESVAEDRLTTLAQLVEGHADATLQRFDALLSIAAAGAAAAPRRAAFADILDGVLDAGGPHLLALALADPLGRTLAMRGAVTADPPVPLARWSAIAAHDWRSGMHVGQPFRMPGGGAALPLARHGVPVDGGHPLIVVALVDPGLFSAFYGSLTRGAGDVVQLLHRDGYVVGHDRAGGETIGRLDPVYQAATAAGAAAPDGSVMVASAAGGVARHYAFRPLERYPLVAAPGVAAAPAPVSGLQVAGLVVISILFTLALAVLGRCLYRAHARTDTVVERNAVLEDVLAASPVAVLIVDSAAADMPVVYANPAFTRVTGYRAAEVLGRNCRYLQGEGTDPLPVETLRAGLRERRQEEVTLLNYRKDGTPFWNHLTIVPVGRGQGPARYLMGVIEDVTGARRAQAALRSSEGRFRSIADAAPMLIGVGRLADGALLYGNPRWHGFVSGDGPSNGPALLFPTAGEWERLVAAVQSSGRFDAFDTVLRHADGQDRPALVSARSIVWDAQPAVLVIALDVSEAKAAEAAASRAAGLTRGILASLTDGLLLIDSERSVVEANLSAERLFGASAGGLIGQAAARLLPSPAELPVPPDPADDRPEIGGAAGATAEAGRRCEGRGRRGDGTEFPVELSVSRLLVGPRRFTIVMVRDIAARKASEAALVEMRDAAILASQAKTTFLGNMSHELRTPLNAIVGFAELMREQTFGPLGHDRYRDYLNNILESAGHLKALVGDLQDLSHIELTPTGAPARSVELRQALAEVEALLPAEGRTRQVGLRVDGVAPVQLSGNREVLRQLFLNLLRSALRLAAAGTVVEVSTTGDRGLDVVVSVDSGSPAPSPDELADLFEPFARTDVMRTSRLQVVGLALTMAKTLAALHGATMAAETAPGGFRLIVRFPPGCVLTPPPMPGRPGAGPVQPDQASNPAA